ncbi:hypothetical protein EDB84DRAFT_1233059, partial [Lactarius hengduanensis]
ELLHMHRQSMYLIGRDHTVADLPLGHPSCSKQHAVIQWLRSSEASSFVVVCPDVAYFSTGLLSANLNQLMDSEAIPTSRYYELKASD